MWGGEHPARKRAGSGGSVCTNTAVLHVPSGTDKIGRRIMRLISVTAFFLFGLLSPAQNLVPNPSFESFTECPNGLSQIDRVNDWSTAGGSPDYFNACAQTAVGVPFNFMGFEWPSSGNGYVGAITYPSWNKEFVQCKLTEPLEVGVVTYVSMRVSPGGYGSWPPPSATLVSSHIGLRLSVDSLRPDTQPPSIPGWIDEYELADAVIYMADLLNDTSGWAYLTTSFVADSAYQFMQIGNFYADSVCSYSVIGDTIANSYYAYAFIDDVCLSTNTDGCGHALVPPSHSLSRLPTCQVFDATLWLRLSDWCMEAEARKASLFDEIGRLVAEKDLRQMSGTIPWPLQHCADGGYFLKIEMNDRSSIQFRVLKTTL